MLSKRQEAILILLGQQKQASISHIKQHLQATVSTPTLNRDLAALVRTKHIVQHGKGRGTTYALAPHHLLFYPIDEALYFAKPPDERQSYKTLRTDLFLELEEATLFTPSEETQLKTLQGGYQNNITKLSPTLYKKELERLTIELSWKSAEIEGNTYSLLETEHLFQDNTLAPHKSYKDARMLLNHKDVLTYMQKHTLKEISIPLIEDLHRILVKDLGIKKNMRMHGVGITGTTYRPPDNIYHIKEALLKACSLLNTRKNCFEKAFLATLLIAYIQPFEDGNKRTARMIGTWFLLSGNACPLSYRSVDAATYKKATLLFYEQNNLALFKKIFLEQNIFANKTYFC